MTKTTVIELAKESFKFSAGHFTIFSATERENIHGHNFTVKVICEAEINENGLAFDYGKAKKHIENMCKSLNEIFLVQGKSKHLKISEDINYSYLHFNDEKIPFLKRDVKILPIQNISVECLSEYFLGIFIESLVFKEKIDTIFKVTVKIFSGPGQSGSATWNRI